MTLALDSPALRLPEPRTLKQAMWRGFTCRCPACGQGRLFGKYLKVADVCPACGEELHHHRADDAPPYFTMMIVGHIVIPLVLVVEKIWHPDVSVHFMLWTAVVLSMTFALMPAVKGAIVGLQWANRMHGFDPAHRQDAE
jgi:uncharacterized protein (DUF983 family)